MLNRKVEFLFNPGPGVCPSLSVVEDVPLRTFSKLAFYWSASATTKQIWKAYEINGAFMGGKRPFPGQRSTIRP